MRSLGDRIRRARIKMGLSQVSLADAIGVKAGTLSGYEREYRRPDVEMLDRIASVLGVSTDYLLGRTDDPTPHGEQQEASPAVNPDPLVDLALEAIPELSPEARTAVERFIEYCRESDRLRRDARRGSSSGRRDSDKL